MRILGVPNTNNEFEPAMLKKNMQYGNIRLDNFTLSHSHCYIQTSDMRLPPYTPFNEKKM